VQRGVLPFVPALTLLLLFGPVICGLAGTLAPAFGWLPAVGATDPGLGAFRALLAWPGLPHAVTLSVVTGLAATLLSVVVVAIIGAAFQGTAAFRVIERLLSPLLSVPHAAAAFGIAFLIAPSGWLARLLSPWATGWQQPPDWLIVQDPAGIALIAGLVAKEVPFLLLMTIAALPQVAPRRSLTAARALGYGRESAWLMVVFPQVYRQIRLAVYVVLAYGMTVVDMAIILGPNTPPTLSVQITRWISDPDLTLRLQAAAAALLQLALVAGALALWRMGEIAVAGLARRRLAQGRRGRSWALLRLPAGLAALTCALAVLGGLAGLALWSVAGMWSFPEVLPDALTGRTWSRFGPALVSPALETALIAGAAVAIALVLAIGCLEAEHRHGLAPSTRALWLLYLPLLVPQVAFLPGIQTLMLLAGVTSGRGAVILAHVVFVFPYVFLSLSDPFRAWDRRLGATARSLGAGPDAVLWRVRLPMLLAPLLTAMAVGAAVSVGQYLPTLLVGGGRVQTLTTEAVALASGGDRRAIGATALVQTATALLPFVLALALPRLVWLNRRGLRDG
jgi:putative thiamine transport system permease protein